MTKRRWKRGGKGREDPYSVCHWANTSLPFSSEPSTARHCATCIFPIHTLSVAPIRSLEPSLSRIVSLVVALSLLSSRCLSCIGFCGYCGQSGYSGYSLVRFCGISLHLFALDVFSFRIGLYGLNCSPPSSSFSLPFFQETRISTIH